MSQTIPDSYGSNHECEKECPTCGQVAIRGADGHYRPLEGSSSGPEDELETLTVAELSARQRRITNELIRREGFNVVEIDPPSLDATSSLTEDERIAGHHAYNAGLDKP
jgi:hypothetical protein